ncbi:DUF4169 family protein [uncultured Brevundimonas sp.]|uniref:DUF4169 family protein n=1 Tax=uncultured Brevundimonas sp. TaxID=213418 RepID=UPI0025FEBFD3|nr:DUF4169 family protein [uncultured Brevundimonas sp.]
MGEIINLNRARKTRAKAEKAETASLNRAAFGQTKAERQKAKAERDRIQTVLDGAKRDKD